MPAPSQKPSRRAVLTFLAGAALVVLWPAPAYHAASRTIAFGAWGQTTLSFIDMTVPYKWLL